MSRTLTEVYNKDGKRIRRQRLGLKEDGEEEEEDQHGWCYIISMAVVGVASILIPVLYFWQTMGTVLKKTIRSDLVTFGFLVLMILFSLVMGFFLLSLAIMNAIESIVRSYVSKKVSHHESLDEEGDEREHFLILEIYLTQEDEAKEFK
ncbi:OLC1v1000946C1 [Oldenlandia corymbosa var. corymbosa]|uniref:OLC1v1000946C1 n=1 Tax=Oldenlandia corymbosa var. corymbosa TaxID=529605 RepID=A0AAV1D562_OLDCO|nr:OLC1v1000946C1 [Oldenlandia corymbosa var. corymbosa]